MGGRREGAVGERREEEAAPLQDLTAGVPLDARPDRVHDGQGHRWYACGANGMLGAAMQVQGGRLGTEDAGTGR